MKMIILAAAVAITGCVAPGKYVWQQTGNGAPLEEARVYCKFEVTKYAAPTVYSSRNWGAALANDIHREEEIFSACMATKGWAHVRVPL